MPGPSIIKIIAISLLIHFSLSFPISSYKDSISSLPRADEDCFATTFGITDFHSFSGSATEPASVSFSTASDNFNGQMLCSRNGENGSTFPYFSTPVPCSKTVLPNFFFSYPEDRILRIYEVGTCGDDE
jgi:hypothetical protein